MSETYIPVAMRRAVISRARHLCEYCWIPDDATLTAHEPDHVIGEQHVGKTVLGNLAYACFRCNRFKGSNIATRDPQSGAIVPLYDPRTENWNAHFRLNGALIEPLTPIGRGTVLLLRLNDEQRTELRADLIEQGRYAPPTR